MLETKSKATTIRPPMIFNRKVRKTRQKPTLEQQLKAIDDLSKLLTDEEKEIFGKIMDKLENKDD